MGPSRETDLAGETRPTRVTLRPTVATAGEADVSKVTAGIAGEGDLTGVTTGVAGVTKVAG
ncbi:hypothetical protein GHT06_018389 [Daphnia sinensis]|uniref:Uncharacterized protein n=1 Tax=Daphnia sinensis TaxID=1820382 RepID=A0AAD5PQT9_9CRUS|nr:hypothetical protein GHT06_018389 [Daphnia sinensis]